MGDLAFMIGGAADGASDMSSALFYVTIALLSLLIFMVVKNVLWGMKRGIVSTLVRIGVMIAVNVLLLFLTPVISKLIFGLLKEPVLTPLLNNLTQGSIPAGFEDLTQSLLMVLSNVVVFMVFQMTLFKLISYGIFRLIVMFAAPRVNKKTGEKNKHNKLLGAFMGAAQGLIAVFFFLLPINALFYSINTIERYEIAAAATESENSNWTDDIMLTLGELHNSVRELDDGLNGSIYGNIIKFTGAQWASGLLSGPLYTIPDTNVDLRQDAVAAINLSGKFEQVLAFIDGLNTGAALTESRFAVMEEVIDSLFDIKLVTHIIDNNMASLANLFEVEGLTGEENELVRQSLKDAADDYLNAEFFKTNLKGVIDIAVLTAGTKIPELSTAEKDATFWTVSNEFLTALQSDEDDISTAANNMRTALNYKPEGETKTLSEKIFADGIGTLPLFKDFLFGGDLHAALIATQLGITLEEARIDDFQTAMGTVSDVLLELTDVANDANKFYKALSEENEAGSSIEAIADLFSKETFTAGMTNILNSLTNPQTVEGKSEPVWGMSKIMRGVMANSFSNEEVTGPAPAEDEISVDAIVYDVFMAFTTELRSENNIPWGDALSLFGDLVPLLDIEGGTNSETLSEIRVILKGDGEKSGLLERMDSIPMFRTLAAELNALIAQYIDEGVDSALPEGWTVSWGDIEEDDAGKVELALEVIDTVIEMIEKTENGDITLDNPEGVMSILGETASIIDILANNSVQITTPGGIITDPRTGEPIDLDAQLENIEEEIRKRYPDEDNSEQWTLLQKSLYVFGLISDKPWITE